MIGSFASSATGQANSPIEAESNQNPLAGFSLRGQGEDLKYRVNALTPFLGTLATLGQFTVFRGVRHYAKPLAILKQLSESIEDKRVDPEQVVFLTMSDSLYEVKDFNSIGEQFGFHVMAVGERDFEPVHLARNLRKMTRDGAAKGRVVLIDDLTAFEAGLPAVWRTELAGTIQEFTRAGSTLIAIEDNSDEPLIGAQLTVKGSSSRQAANCEWTTSWVSACSGDADFVVFERKAACGCCTREVAYRYPMSRDMSFRAVFDSIEYVWCASMEEEVAVARQMQKDTPYIRAVLKRLNGSRPVAKTRLAAEVADLSGLSGSEVFEVLDRYCGDTEPHHLWNFKIGSLRGRMFSLNAKGEAICSSNNIVH